MGVLREVGGGGGENGKESGLKITLVKVKRSRDVVESELRKRRAGKREKRKLNYIVDHISESYILSALLHDNVPPVFRILCTGAQMHKMHVYFCKASE